MFQYLLEYLFLILWVQVEREYKEPMETPEELPLLAP
jgi:hypothetical protein